MVAAIGRQASSNPAGQTTAGRNVGPDPIQLRSDLRTKDRSWRHRRDPHLLAARHQSVQVWIRPLQRSHVQRRTRHPAYAASHAMGITGLPAGQAAQALSRSSPSSGDQRAPTNWGGHGSQRHHRSELHAARQRAVERRQALASPSAARSPGCSINVMPATGGSTPLTIDQRRHRDAALNKSKQPGNPSYAATPTPVSPMPASSSARSKGSLTPESRAGVRLALPRHLSLCSGQLEGDSRS